MTFRNFTLSIFAAMAVASANQASALTIAVDGVGAAPNTTATLAWAVQAVYAAEDGPDIINITVNSLTSPEPNLIINQPLTINGDGENDGVGDGTPCDILFDVSSPIAGIQGRALFEVQAVGAVNISDLRVHPDEDCGQTGDAAIRMGLFCAAPPSGDHTTNIYTFTRLEFSGSQPTAPFAFIDPATGNDLYNGGGFKWGGSNAATGEANYENLGGVIQLGNNSPNTGTYSAKLDHCKAAMTYGTGLNIENVAKVEVLGGLYGHSARDGICVQTAADVVIKGVANDRVRVVRSSNIGGQASHTLDLRNSVVSLIEYVDLAGVNTANLLAVRGSQVGTVRYVRGLGKFNPATAVNHAFYVEGAAGAIDLVEHSTFHANAIGNPGNSLVPLILNSAVADSIQFKDSIFTSGYVDELTSNGIIANQNTTVSEFLNCAIPIDLQIGESLTTEGEGIKLGSGATVTTSGIVKVSPQYDLTLADYDWSDNQGASNPLNGPGNRNVLRPTNPAYNAAATGNLPLTGGAGPLPDSRVEEWMLL